MVEEKTWNQAIRIRLKLSLSYMCRARKRSGKDRLSQVVKHTGLSSRSAACSANALQSKSMEIEIAQKRLLRNWRGSEELDGSWGGTCGGVIRQHVQEDRSEENVTVRYSFFQIWNLQEKIQGKGSSYVEKIELLQIELCREMLNQMFEMDLTGVNQNGDYTLEAFVGWLDHIDAWVAPVVYCMTE